MHPITLDDHVFILELLNSEGWLQFIGDRKVHSAEDAVQYIQRLIDSAHIEYWVARLQNGKTPIGVVTFIKRPYLPYHDIGFAFLPAFAGQGYAHEATQAILLHNIEIEAHAHILAFTIPANTRSIQLLKKLGLEFEKEIEINQEQVDVYGASADQVCITAITQSFFGAFTNKAGQEPGLRTLHQLCILQAQIIKKTPDDEVIDDITSFIIPREKILTDGTLVEFEEKEIHATTTIAGHIAQRYSEYEKKGILNGNPFTQRGYKLFQFIKTGGKWKISSVLWEDQTDGH